MKVVIFGGTTESRKLSVALSDMGVDVTLSVATEFGRDMAGSGGMTVLADRLEAENMIDLLKQGAFDCAIDATHPYAVLATQNILSACQAAGIKYFRLKRPESAAIQGAIYVPDTQAAVEKLKKNDEKALLTVGSKELALFTQVENYESRFFVRILPMPDSLKKALDLGFRGANIICMQGPFSREMNEALLKSTGVKFLVTKDSGDAGGFEAKVSAALSLGCEVIVIKRPFEEGGKSFDEILSVIHRH